MKIGFFDDYQLGVVKDDSIVSIMPLVEDIPAPSPQWLMNGVIERWRDLEGPVAQRVAAAPGVPLSGVRLRPPLPQPGLLICMAVNYLEFGQRVMPDIDAFVKSSDCVIGDGDTVNLDPDCPATIFHHEAELALVIGKRADHVSQADAMDHIFGYTGFMDISARGITPGGRNSFYLGKSWSTFGPMGPWIVTRDEIADPHNLDILMTNNGEKRHDFNTSDMAHNIPECIEFCSRISSLNPGDLISTGTNHQGIGPIQDGDRVVLTVQGIGELHVDVKDPSRREWPRGIDEAFAARVRNAER